MLKEKRISRDELKKRSNVVLKCIHEQFPKSPEGKLMFAVIAQAISDIINDFNKQEDRIDALRYIKKDLIHAEICGIKREWVQKLICKAFKCDKIEDLSLPIY